MSIESAKGPAPAPVQESVGAALNRMSGVQTEKNLYAPKNEMGKDSFLKMFTEQLKNQDPLNPVKNEQFSQQMATFSQLEQQMQTNKNLEKMIQQQSNMQIAALQLVGKNVQADRAALYHDRDKPSAVQFKLPVDATELKVMVQNQAGETIKTINLGARQQGDIATKWDGFTEDGRQVENGRYSYKISAKDPEGKDITVPTKIDGRVTGITTEKGITYLLVGDQKVGLSDVETIKEGGAGDGKAAEAAKPLFGQAAESAKKPTEVSVDLGKPAGTEGEPKTAEKDGEVRAQVESSSESDRPSIYEDERSMLGDKNLRNPFLPIMFR